MLWYSTTLGCEDRRPWQTSQSSSLPPSVQLSRRPMNRHDTDDHDVHRPAIGGRSHACPWITNERAGKHQQRQGNLSDDSTRHQCDACRGPGWVQAESSPTRDLGNFCVAPGPQSHAIRDHDTVLVSRADLEYLVAELQRYSPHKGSDQFGPRSEAATRRNVSQRSGIQPRRPASRSDFEIAILCALIVEQNAVHALFDQHWDDNDPAYDKDPLDTNSYSYGAIGRHNVVLVHMPGMGKANAAAAAAYCRVSFPNLRLALIVGVCGALPFVNTVEEVILGDVIIGDGIVQYDFGRQYPDQFVRRNTLHDSIGRPSPAINAYLKKLGGQHGHESLLHAMETHLRFLQSDPRFKDKYQYPGAEQDVLYKPESNIVVPRRRLKETPPRPHVHIGTIASGDTLMRYGTRRDTIASEEGIIAFEMEGAGVFDNIPHVVIKGVSDYADSHKTKAWQPYAAATAAACMKAFLRTWVPTRRSV